MKYILSLVSKVEGKLLIYKFRFKKTQYSAVFKARYIKNGFMWSRRETTSRLCMNPVVSYRLIS
jgi:hypothetical protein